MGHASGRHRAALVGTIAAVFLSSPLAGRAQLPLPSDGGDALVLPSPAGLTAAVAAIEGATGAKAEVLEAGGKSVALTEGCSFALDEHTANRLVAGSHAAFLKAGLFLFRYERSFNLPGEKDQVGLLATRDQDAVIRRIGTAGTKRGVTSEQIIAWLHALAKDEPFEVTEVGVDYIAGRFVRTPRDPEALARRAAEFAPDLVKGHKDPIAGLTDLIGNRRTLYLIWDN